MRSTRNRSLSISWNHGVTFSRDGYCSVSSKQTAVFWYEYDARIGLGNKYENHFWRSYGKMLSICWILENRTRVKLVEFVCLRADKYFINKIFPTMNITSFTRSPNPRENPFKKKKLESITFFWWMKIRFPLGFGTARNFSSSEVM